MADWGRVSRASRADCASSARTLRELLVRLAIQPYRGSRELRYSRCAARAVSRARATGLARARASQAPASLARGFEFLRASLAK